MALLITFSLAVAVLALFLLLVRGRRKSLAAPGPTPWPLLGSLHLLGQYEVPFEALSALARQYGEVYSITLGSTPCLVVNSFPRIREVLITKGAQFGGRPDFMRFHALFGGDRNNSLALCDWSDLQKTRRSIARLYCSPRSASSHYDVLDAVGTAEVGEFIRELARSSTPGQPYHVKPLIQLACANMFTRYMCSARFPYGDPGFRQIVRIFDEIFWEINQGYAVDFLPWLKPAYSSHMRKISRWAADIRQFILARIIAEHRRRSAELATELDADASNDEPRDFTDALLRHLETDPNLNWEHIVFELEDFLGGHSAIGNLTMLTLAAAVRYPHVASRIQQEVDHVTEGGARPLSMFDKPNMPYTEATILETLRTASSPIVPHVATQDTDIAGYAVTKGTVVFLNNYELNTSPDYWIEPHRFMPERFLSPAGIVTKPEHFIPFSTGKRSCVGQRLVQSCTFLMVGATLQHFNIAAAPGESMRTIPACVAVPPDTFPFVFTPRHNAA
ncbi:cytochrome P450 307a1 [Anabrus simplex]|uniref:cytochrome P450 307a1 n=1 Tax=Anabrus simplex TaxID=316456 RepID=UPI0035A2A243